jgi:hypothetical protein
MTSSPALKLAPKVLTSLKPRTPLPLAATSCHDIDSASSASLKSNRSLPQKLILSKKSSKLEPTYSPLTTHSPPRFDAAKQEGYDNQINHRL